MMAWVNQAFYQAVGRTMTITIPRWFIRTRLIRIHHDKFNNMVMTFRILGDRKFSD